MLMRAAAALRHGTSVDDAAAQHGAASRAGALSFASPLG